MAPRRNRRNPKYTRRKLEAMKRNELVKAAKASGVKASGKSIDLIDRIMNSQQATKESWSLAREAGRLKLISGHGLQRQTSKRSGYDAIRHGRGPFRYVIVRNGQIVVDAGPVTTAREASIAAKTLLRTKAKAFVHPISQAAGNDIIDAKGTGLEDYGRVVDGYVVQNLPGHWEAYVYQPKDPNIAYSGGRGFDRLMPTGRGKLSPLSLMNVPDDFAARPPKSNRKRNGTKKGQVRKTARRAYKRTNSNKYAYLYVLQGNYGYGHGWEDLSAEDKAKTGAWKRIRQTRKEYRENEGGSYRIIERREVGKRRNGTKTGQVRKTARRAYETTIHVGKYGSRWGVQDSSGWLVTGIKTKRSATSIAGEISSYRHYKGKDHTGRRINGFEVGGRYGYYAVDEKMRGTRPSYGSITRTVASDMTKSAATELAAVLNATLPKSRRP